MKCDISLKVKELGEVRGVFAGATKNNIYLENVVFNNAISTTVTSAKIARKYIVSACRLQKPSLEGFSQEELENVKQMCNKGYKEEADRLLKSIQSVSMDKSPTVDITTKPSVQNLIRNYESNSKLGTGSDSENTSQEAGRRTGAAGKVVKLADNQKQEGGKTEREATEWNQFEANEKLFGIKSEFNMDEYSVPVDSNDENYEKNYKKSEKLAEEIMKGQSESEDAHRHAGRDDRSSPRRTEEALYSSVDMSARVWGDKEKKAANNPQKQKIEPEEPSPIENEELNNAKEKIEQAIGVDTNAMWSGVAFFLSKKNQLTKTGAEPEAAVPNTKLQEQPAQKPEGFDVSDKDGTAQKPAAHGTRDARQHKADRESAMASPGAGFRQPQKGVPKDGHQQKSQQKSSSASRKFESSSSPSESKKTDRIFLGERLKFETASELFKSIESKFHPFVPSVSQKSWSTTSSTVADRIEFIKNQTYIFPPESRMPELSAFSSYRPKK